MKTGKVSATQAAAIIGVSAPRVIQLIKDGVLTAERRQLGKQVRVLLDEEKVRAYAREREEFLAVT
jgi:hypothetical protein